MTMLVDGYFLRRNSLEANRFILLLPDDWRGEALAFMSEKLGAVPYPY
jgi:hypothetical protein